MLVTEPLPFLIGVCFATYVAADTGDDISSLVSDLGPLLFLFGELPTAQFMSQALGWADNIILSMAPLGIITIIIAAIRVGGPSWFRSIIGRAREGRADVEAELMSSTSAEVCELWDGEQVVRVVGEGAIREFVILVPKGIAEDSQTTTGLVAEIGSDSVGNQKSDTNMDQEIQVILKDAKGEGYPWKLDKHEPNIREWIYGECIQAGEHSNGDIHEDDSSSVIVVRNTQNAPNITLNCHNQFARRELYLVAAFGIFLQLGVLAYSGCATYYPKLLFILKGDRVAKYDYPCTAAGTLILVIGMLICSNIVEGSTSEERYCPGDGKEARIVWLQRSEIINDESLGPHAIFPREAQALITTSQRNKDLEEPKSTTKTSSQVCKARANSSQSLLDSWKPQEVKTVIGAFLGICGFVVQFVGLRTMHWSASVAQLGAVIVMTILRAWVRRDLAEPPKAQPLDSGHELDWLAMTLGGDLTKAPWLHPPEINGKQTSRPWAGKDKDGWDWEILAVEVRPNFKKQEPPARTSDNHTNRYSESLPGKEIGDDKTRQMPEPSPRSSHGDIDGSRKSLPEKDIGDNRTLHMVESNCKKQELPPRTSENNIDRSTESQRKEEIGDNGPRWTPEPSLKGSLSDIYGSRKSLPEEEIGDDGMQQTPELNYKEQESPPRASENNADGSSESQRKEEIGDDGNQQTPELRPSGSDSSLSSLPISLIRTNWDTTSRHSFGRSGRSPRRSSRRSCRTRHAGSSSSRSDNSLSTSYMYTNSSSRSPRRGDVGGGRTRQTPEQERQGKNSNTKSKADKVMKTRRDLGKLAGWHGPASEEAISLARSIEVTMDTLLVTVAQEFTWSLQTGRGESLHFRLKKLNGAWKAYSDQIEAALSLWLYSVYDRENTPEVNGTNNKLQTTDKTLDQEEVGRLSGQERVTKTPSQDDDDEWLRAKGTRSKHSLQLLGSYTASLYQDLGWWMPNGTDKVIGVIGPEPTEPTRTEPTGPNQPNLPGPGPVDSGSTGPDRLNRPGSGSTGSGSTGFGSTGFESTRSESTRSRSTRPESTEPESIKDMNEIELETHRIVGYVASSYLTPTGQDGKCQYKVRTKSLGKDAADQAVDGGETAKVILAAESYSPLKALYAQHMFSAFMWAAAETMEDPIPGKVDIRPTETGDTNGDSAWKSFALHNSQLSKLAQDIQGTGLGTLEEIYLCMIPPLSAEQRLPPVSAIIEWTREHVKPLEQLGRWKEAGDAYLWLVQTTKITGHKNISNKAIALLAEHLRAMVDAIKLREVQQFEDKVVKQLKDLEKYFLEELRKAGKDDMLVLLGRLFDLQQRPWVCSLAEEDNLSESIDWVDEVNLTALHGDIVNNDLDDIAKTRAFKGREVDEIDILDWTPLHYAATNNSLNALHILLRNQANVNARDVRGRTPLHYACWKDHTTLVENLKRCNMRGKDRDVVVSKYREVEQNPFPEVKDIDVKDIDQTATRHWELVQTLLREGADIDVQDIDGIAPIHCCAMYSHEKVLSSLMEAGAKVDLADGLGYTPLLWAAYKGHKAAVAHLWKDANRKLRDHNSRTHLHLAAMAEAKDDARKLVVEFLLEHEAEREARDRFGQTPLHCAVKSGHEDIVALLLESSTKNGHEGIAALGANIEAEDSNGRTALHWAARSGHKAVLQLLLASGAKKKAVDNHLRTVLHYAAENGHEDIVTLLLESSAKSGHEDITAPGVDIKAKDSDRRTALHWAARNGHKAVVQLLLERGAKKKAVDYDLRTVLHYAAAAGHEAVVRLLLKNGVKVHAIDRFRHEALHYATRNGHHVIEGLLIDWGAKSGRVN